MPWPGSKSWICSACCEPVRTMEEAMHDPNFQKRQAVVSLENKAGEQIQAPGIPIRLSDTPGGID